MGSDPVVAEVRAVRERLAAECGNDLREIFRRARQYQADSGVTCVRYAARRAEAPEDANVDEDGRIAEKSRAGEAGAEDDD